MGNRTTVSQEKITDSHFWIFLVFKKYPQKSQIWKSETSPNQGTWRRFYPWVILKPWWPAKKLLQILLKITLTVCLNPKFIFDTICAHALPNKEAKQGPLGQTAARESQNLLKIRISNIEQHLKSNARLIGQLWMGNSNLPNISVRKKINLHQTFHQGLEKP